MFRCLASGLAGLALGLGVAEVSSSTDPGFSVTARPDLATMTAAVIRPTSPDQRMAFDVTPRGQPAEMANHGFAWVDICDTDVLATPQASMRCARAAVTGRDVRFGVMAFNGAEPVPVRIVSNSAVLATFSAGPDRRLIVGDFDSADVLRRLDAIEAQVAAQLR
jgi:hypothetical protein